METVIIGIHGLRNKPPRYVLAQWWKKAIIEGFGVLRRPVPRFRFELAYWAHYMHTRPQNPSITDRDHPQYLREPYLPGTCFGPRDPETFRKQLSSSIHQQLMKIIAGRHGFMNIDAVSNAILHRMFVELDTYYHHKLRDSLRRMRPARECIRGELARLIRKHRKKQILLLAHSMGSIIAYDVLLHVVPDVPIHTMITMGSPLGFPVVMKKIRQELGMPMDCDTRLPTPSNIRVKWLNFADLQDETCLHYNLRNNYGENGHGVRPFDQVVYNTYESDGVVNPHKSYGYLRTAEVTEALHHFLVLENAGVWERIKWVFARPVV